jgi:hypothetical protein
LNYQNLRGTEIILKKWWNLIKKILIWEGADPISISELIDNESENPNVLLILKYYSIRIQILRIRGLKMAKIQGERIDKCKIAILNIDSILIWIILSLRNVEVLNFASSKWVYMLKSVEKGLCKWLVAPSWITPPFWSFE